MTRQALLECMVSNNNSYKTLKFELMPVFLLWGIWYLTVDGRDERSLRQMINTDKMRPLWQWILDFRNHKKMKQFITTEFLLRMLDSFKHSAMQNEKVRLELKDFLQKETKLIKFDPKKTWREKNITTLGRFSLCLCIGAAIFFTRKGKSEEYIENLYKELCQFKVNHALMVRLLANGFHKESIRDEELFINSQQLLSVYRDYFKVIARECHSTEEGIATMIAAGFETPNAPITKKRKGIIRENTNLVGWLFPTKIEFLKKL